MTRFLYSSLLMLALFASCSAVQTRQSDTSVVAGTHLDVDINGRLFVIDAEKNVLRQYSKDLVLQKEIGGTGWGNDQFDHPMGVWARNGIDVFVADNGNHRIQRFDRNLAFVSSFSTRNRSNLDDRLPEGRAGFGYPTDIAVSRHGDLFICDGENSRILKVIGLSKIEKTFGGFDAGKGLLHKPSQLEIGPNDNVYVQDGQRVVVFDNFGNFIRVIGEGVFAGTIYISADESGLIVLGDQNLLFFDRDDRLILTVGLHEMNIHSPRAFVFSRGTAYFLTARGISAVADPRRIHSNEKQ